MGINIGLPGAFLIVGVCFILAGLPVYIKLKHEKERCTLEVPFEVMKWTYHRRDHTKYYRAVYGYNVNGVEYTAKSRIETTKREVRFPTLKVNPDNPKEIYEGTIWLGQLFIGLGVALSLLGFALLVYFNWW